MAWDLDTHRYRGKVVSGQAKITTNKNDTLMAEALIECTAGPQQGQRVRYRGFISGPHGAPSEKNAASTAAELRVMGAALVKGWKDLAGIGSKTFEFSVRADENEGKTYYRACFIREQGALNVAREATDDIAAAHAVPPPPAPNGKALPPVPGPADEWDESAEPEEQTAFP